MTVNAYRPLRHAEALLTLRSIEQNGHLRGTVRVPAGSAVVCSVFAVREDDGPDWLVFYLPLGALARTNQDIGGFPFGDDGGERSHSWRRPLDAWLADVGARLYAEVPFRLGLIGFQVSGSVYADEIAQRLPSERWNGFLIPTNGLLQYHEANHRHPLATVGQPNSSAEHRPPRA